jgi:hypothetical protein
MIETFNKALRERVFSHVAQLYRQVEHVPGDLIDGHMAGKPLGATESYVQELDGRHFLVHCCRDADWTTKIMLSHGILDKNQDHPTWRKVDSQWKTFKYAGWTTLTNVVTLQFCWRVSGRLNGGRIFNLHSYCPWQR